MVILHISSPCAVYFFEFGALIFVFTKSILRFSKFLTHQKG